MKPSRINLGRSGSSDTPDFGLLPGEWVEEAACRNSKQPDDWHPSHDVASAAASHARAVAVCRTCPVATPCLQFALDAGPRMAQGIHAGTTVDQRREALKRRVA